ncbi:LysR family transcriptional regulator [Herbaspirillum autotrophicum]|uniref:LysR family transcriptional regulator n=1 Tax=Herbaspirillum autotrophicum TaxID=180195 RepID=UPI00067AAEF1|nr:LysR family transcriptional regulator [Herbaspirillum autotrophicum]
MQKKISSSILRYFFEVARTGSLRAAASSLHIATSAISRQISNLEEMLGASLFNRGPQGMTLSEPGKILADFTIDLFQRESALIDQINAAVGAGSGLIKIASTEEFASHFLPQAIRTFMNANPDSRFDICIGKAVHVSQMVEDGNADLGLSISLPGPASNHMEYSEPSTVSVVIPAGHALTGRPTLSIADLYLHPFAVVNGDAMLSELLQRSFARERMMFNPLLVSDSVLPVKAFIQHCGAIAVLDHFSAYDMLSSMDAVAIELQAPELHGFSIAVQSMHARKLPQTVCHFRDQMISAIATRRIRAISPVAAVDNETAVPCTGT